MSALAYSTNKSDNAPSVTTISASARIDYIFRFSKQTILVVNDNAETFSQIGSQFIASLPEDQNTAFISVSSKLNNIQMRCRVIEQLFGNSLFDPERSLAVSIINLSKANNDAISIVIENADLLSLQLLHELCQVSEIAKKMTKDINVLLIGAIETGSVMANNRSLFDNKVSILSANTGQLVSLGSKKLKNSTSSFSLFKAKKVWLASLMCLTVIIASLVVLQQREPIDFSSLIEKNFNEKNEVVSNFVLPQKDKLQSVKTENELVNENVQAASNEDILKAIVNLVANDKGISNQQAVASIAEVTASIQSMEIEKEANKSEFTKQEVLPLAFSNDNNAPVIIEPVIKEKTFTESNVDEITTNKEPRAIPSNVSRQINDIHYQDKSNGFLVQIAGFTQFSVFEEFISEYTSLDYLGYYRILNQQEFLVITSNIFSTRDEAEKVLLSLPIELQEGGAWVKSLEAVNSEIEQYQQSH